MNEKLDILRLKLKKYSNAIKIIVSIIILILIFRKVDFVESISMFSKLNIMVVFSLLTIVVIQFFTQVFQWLFCLQITKSDEIEFSDLIKTHLIGLALRFFMPGGYATFGKMFYLDPNKKKQSFISILIEKFYSVWIILFFASLACILHFKEWKIIFYVVTALIAFFPIFVPILFKRIVEFELIESFYIALPKIILIQIVYVFLTFVQYYLLLSTILSVDLSFISICIGIALVLVANVIPITFSGLGLREIASAMVLPHFGVPAEAAVGASLIIFLFNSVLPAIPGLYYIVRKKT